MQGEFGRRQHGRVLIALLVIVVLGLSAGIYRHETKRTAERDRALALEAKERQAKIDAEREELRKADIEREALERKQADAKRQDSLAVSLRAVDDLALRWEDAVKLAGGTGRIALSGPLSSLQAIKRDAAGLVVPPCLEAGKQELIAGMDLTVEAYLVFQSNPSGLGGVLSQDKLTLAGPHFEKFKADRRMCPQPSASA